MQGRLKAQVSQKPWYTLSSVVLPAKIGKEGKNRGQNKLSHCMVVVSCWRSVLLLQEHLIIYITAAAKICTNRLIRKSLITFVEHQSVRSRRNKQNVV